MVDLVTTQILENGPRRIVTKFTNFSDGTGETGVVKVDATATGPYGVMVQGNMVYPTTHLKIVDIIWEIRTMGLRIQWEATANVDALILSGNGAGPWTFLDTRAGFQGIVNNGGAGATGSLLFTTFAAAPTSSYTVILNMIKGIPQS